jgi:tRNA(fMet)-specific endonuclease VapC
LTPAARLQKPGFLPRLRLNFGAYDTLLAGQAIRRGLVLVTANVAEFARVSGLTWQNWAE